MSELKDKQWFIDRIGKFVYRDSNGCECSVCKSIVEYGFKIHGPEQVDVLFDTQNSLSEDGIYLNYRDEK